MEMRDLNTEQMVGRPEAADQRVELYTQLRNIIDNARESIRALKEENAMLAARNSEMSGRIGVLERQLRAVTTDLANDEMALRQSAETLEQALKGTLTAAPTQQPVARLTPIHAGTPAAAPPETPASPPVAEPAPMDAMPDATSPEAEPAAAEMAEAALPDAEMHPSEPPATEIPAEQPPTAEGPAAADSAPAALTPPATRADGSYTLIAYPFVRFSDLGQFQAALQKLTGVHDVQVRRFAQGTLEMRLGYTGTTDLASTLRTFATGVEDVTEEEPYRLRVRLRTSQDG